MNCENVGRLLGLTLKRVNKTERNGIASFRRITKTKKKELQRNLVLQTFTHKFNIFVCVVVVVGFFIWLMKFISLFGGSYGLCMHP